MYDLFGVITVQFLMIIKLALYIKFPALSAEFALYIKFPACLMEQQKAR